MKAKWLHILGLCLLCMCSLGAATNTRIDGTTATPNADQYTDHLLALLVFAWAAISLFGLMAGLKGRIIVYCGWGDVTLAGLCLAGVVFIVAVSTDISGSPGGPLPWQAVVWSGSLGVLLLFRDYRTNHSLLRALLVLLTQLFLVGLLVSLLMLSISKMMDLSRSKNRRESVENGLGALGAIVGTGGVAYLVNRLVRQGQSESQLQPTPDDQMERVES